MAKQNTSRVALRVVEPAANWLSLEDLEQELKSWIAAGARQGYSAPTLAHRRGVGGKLVWFLRERGHRRCGREEVTAFLDYLTTAHTEGGRFAVKRMDALDPATLMYYFARLQSFFNWLVAQEVLAESPMRKLAKPKVPEDQIVPFSEEEVERLFAAAERSFDPVRNEAILLMLFDTGIRASELCRLTVGDVDLNNHRCQVLGKGGKTRYVPLGERLRRALRRLIGEYRDAGHPDQPAPRTQPVFASRGGKTAGEALTRTGLYQLVRKLGDAAGISETRCSPHTFRHTFAVSYLRNKASVFALQQTLGHQSLAMTRRYVNLAEADLQAQHEISSPADNLFGKRRRR